MRAVIFETQEDYWAGKGKCPVCGGKCKHKRTVDVEPSGNVDIYECKDCKGRFRG